MTVLIKGMKMPNGCVDCIFCWPGDADAYCIAQSYHKETGGTHNHKIQSDYGIGYEEQKTWREPTCPLLKVNTPHGRLIDHKKLEKDLGKRWDTNDDQDFCNKEVWHALEEAPTVIEAEGE